VSLSLLESRERQIERLCLLDRQIEPDRDRQIERLCLFWRVCLCVSGMSLICVFIGVRMCLICVFIGVSVSPGESS